MCAELAMAKRRLGVTGTLATSNLCAASEPEADCASEL